MVEMSVSRDAIAEAVRSERLVPYDLQDTATWDAPLELSSRIRQQQAVTWSGEYGGFWNLTTYELVLAGASDGQLYSSANGASPVPFDLEAFRMVPLELDDPKHRQIRLQLWPFFSPPAIRAAEGPIRNIVQELLAACMEASPADMVADFSRRVPSRVFSSLFLREQSADTLTWIHAHLDDVMRYPVEATEKTIPELLAWCSDALERHRQDDDRESLIGTIAHMGYEGDLLMSDRERTETLFLMVIAGMETTANMLGHTCEILATDQSVRDELRGAPDETLHRAVHEILRNRSGVLAAARTLTQDIDLDGCPVRKGDRVYLNWGAANHDPKMFPDPTKVDLNRQNPGKHVAFGAGVHRCLGSHLAEAELRIAVDEISKCSAFELVPGTEIHYRAGMNWGPRAVPVNLG